MRYPQVSSLDDPMFGATLAPGSWGSNDVEFGYRVEVSQKYPWPGKRRLRGETALAEASAAASDIDSMRLQLTEAAQHALYDYYLVERALEVNERGRKLLEESRKATETLFANPPKDRKISIQDVIQVDLEIGRQQERRLTLQRMRKVAVARINTLMHAPPDADLPPPPKALVVQGGLPEAGQLRAAALARRPDLQALAHRIEAEQAALALAEREYAPDVEVMAAYDTIMGNGPTRDLAPQVGVRFNLPIRREKRSAAVAEAEARLGQRRAELDRQIDQLNFEVQQAYEQVREGQEVVRLYELPKDGILDRARQNVDAARNDYPNGLIPATAMIEAQRSLVNLRERYHEAVAEYFRRRATLERVIGGSLAP